MGAIGMVMWEGTLKKDTFMTIMGVLGIKWLSVLYERTYGLSVQKGVL